MANKELRIGVTMREVQANGYHELRDALAQDWARFLATALPGAAWLPIPNIGAEPARDFAERWKLTGLILSGGDDLGNSARDETERALFEYFHGRGLPVMGICRGMQLIWNCLGGELAKVEGHRAVRHTVNFFAEPKFGIDIHSREVNSYHAFCIARTSEENVHEAVPFARANDGTMEGFYLGDSAVTALMWHPERETPPHPQDVALMRRTFGMEGNA